MSPWWQTAVIYQIYPRSFQDTTGNGVGDLPGITSRLGYLRHTLGVDAVWISPFFTSPMADFGYDVADYCDVDPLFGTLDDFDAMLAEAHRIGLEVIVDWVPNHSSDQHAWFKESRSWRDNPKRDWYVWRDAKTDGSPPNNWLSVFGGPAWTWDEPTQQWYLHSFLAAQPDLNWRNPEVKEAMLDTLRFWLDRGVDGFRMDVVHFIMKDPDMRDNPPAVAPQGEFKSMGGYDAQEHPYDKGHPDVHDVFKAFRELLDSYGDRFSVGEIHEFDWSKWATYYGTNLDELHMPFNFSLLWSPWEAVEMRRRVDALEAALPDGAWPNYVLGNHDEPRLTERIGIGPARVAAVMLLTLRGTPTIYYGDELGMTQVDVPPERQQDPWGVTEPGLGRDGCRTPMQWSPAEHAGFAPADTPATWLPLNEDWRRLNVEVLMGDDASMLTLYRELLWLRSSTTALQTGSYRPVDAGAGVFAYVREAGAERFVVALNFTDDEVDVALEEKGTGRIAAGTHDVGGDVDLAGFTLGANEGVVVEMATPGE